MLDARLRRLAGRPLDRLGEALASRGLSAEAVTAAGFGVGGLAAAALAVQAYWPALALILANRLLDGLDGAVARHRGPTDFGGFLDIVCDFVVYAGIVLGFALGRPDMALPAAFLIFSFVGTGTSFLAFAVAAAKRGISTGSHGAKSFYYLGGLTEATETTALFLAICLWPDGFAWLAWGFGALCWATAATRVAQARALLR